MRLLRSCLAGCAAVLAGVGSVGAVNIETVRVGNPGNGGMMRNANNPGRVCGAVAYTYQMGKYEVTAGQYVEFLNAVARTDEYRLYDTGMNYPYGGCGVQRSGISGEYVYSVAPDWAMRPVTMVSWGSAVRFVNWLENGQPKGPQGPSTTEDGSYALNGATGNAALLAVTRKPGARWVLPSEDEWFKAGYHKNDGPTDHYWKYPTGSDTMPKNVLAYPDPGNSANHYDTQGTGTGGETIGPPYFRTEVGAFANSPSPYGTFDQGGNVWEWSESPFDQNASVCQGGSFSSWNGGLMDADYRFMQFPENLVSDTGFRVAYVPEPATLALVTIGGTLFARRRQTAW